MDWRLRGIVNRLDAAASTNIGFPAARDIDYRPLAPLLGHLLNNVGDPQSDPLHPGHTNDLERDVLTFIADQFRAPPGWSGYITSGGTEGNLYALWLGRTTLPNAVVYYSQAAHCSVAKACHLLGLEPVDVPATSTGEIDYAALTHHAGRRRSRPAIVVANIGTTMTEAVDDVARIHTALDTAGITHRYVHSDAALAGIPLLSAPDHPPFDFADGADSITVSGHKWFGTPLVCGVVIACRKPSEVSPAIQYTGNRDTTISGSRNGLAAAMLWYAITPLGATGLTRRADQSRHLADYALARLRSVGWPAWRNPHALTVMLRPLPEDLAGRWRLPTHGSWSHLICMPGVTADHIDELMDELETVPKPETGRHPGRSAAAGRRGR